MRVKTKFTRAGTRIVNFRANKRLINELKNKWKEFAGKIVPYQGGYSGRGIVICAGGVRYLTCAWVNINLLRRNGCALPIEVWYADGELTGEVIEALRQLNVICRNAGDHTDVNVSGYALKPFAIINSSFKEVLYLDADNNAIRDPTYLFDSEQYKNCGVLFWPDFWTTDNDNPIWKIVGSSAYLDVEQESGQILINKEKCWKELNLCLHFNQDEYYYKMLLGDKDTFKFAWIALRSKYHFITTPAGFCGFSDTDNRIYSRGMSMAQHDCEGNIIFIHRNGLKWDMTYGDEIAWRKVKRFKRNAERREFKFATIRLGEGAMIYTYDIDGDIEIVDFSALFEGFEGTCLQILKDLRGAEFYQRFLWYDKHLRQIKK